MSHLSVMLDIEKRSGYIQAGGCYDGARGISHGQVNITYFVKFSRSVARSTVIGSAVIHPREY